MALEVLQELGLTPAEIKAYLALLELGQSTTGPIIDKAKISSSKIYLILDKLVFKGLASYVMKGNIKYFEATPPERILDLLKEKEEELSKQREAVKKILPELSRKLELSKNPENAAIFRGIKGLETVFYESLHKAKKGDILYVIGIPTRSDKSNRFFVKFNRERASRGIKAKQLFNEKARGELQTLLENNPLAEIRYMPEGIITPAAINVINDRTIIFPQETGDDPLIILIENKEIADSFRAQFKLLWENQTITIIGKEGPLFILKDIIDTLNQGEEELFVGLDIKKKPLFSQEAHEDYFKGLEKKNLKERVILEKGMKYIGHPRSIRKFLPKEYFTPLTYDIYGDKVATTNWEMPITTTIIKNKALADNFRVYFNSLWKIAKEK